VTPRLPLGPHPCNPFCLGREPKARVATLGWRKLDPERGGKQGELAGTCTCLKCIPKGWLVVAANAGSHDPVRVL
jgi:hypothetical protein